jgi:hypothetical protein
MNELGVHGYMPDASLSEGLHATLRWEKIRTLCSAVSVSYCHTDAGRRVCYGLWGVRSGTLLSTLQYPGRPHSREQRIPQTVNIAQFETFLSEHGILQLT